MYLVDTVRVDLLIKFLSIFGVIAAFITALVSVRKYFYEKNRDIYIRRLNEVYAPLYRLLIRQETLRKMRFPHIKIKDAPIITTITQKTKQTLNLTVGEPITLSQESSEEVGILDRLKFLKVFNESNMGLARPNLLNLMYQYEVLIYLEESNIHDEHWAKASSEKVRVEILLIKEIVTGFRDTIKRLEIDDYQTISIEEDFFKEIE